jgi:rhodanese-related sulfurtransferase
MNRFLLKITLSAALLLTTAGAASAEIVKGRVKAIAPESKLFSLIIDQEKVLLMSWDNKTAWKGISSSSELKLDEILSVDFNPVGASSVASSVSRIKTPLPAGIKVMSLDRLAENLTAKEGSHSFTLVDTRTLDRYDAGHIPGAISIPLSRIEKRTYGLLPEAKDAKLVFYDEGQGGETAGKAAEISGRIGYTDVAVFPEGAAGWVDSGRILGSSTAFIRKTRPAVIDVRSKDLVAQGHIEGAVNYPYAVLKNYYGYLPMEKLAPIVLYGDSDNDAVNAAKTLLNWGYRRVTIYPGGASSWVKNAEVLETGPAGEEIYSAVASHGGKLDPKDFEMALISTVMVEIVDARSAAEQNNGGFPRAKKIPLQELAKRYGELDRDKIQVIFAADPVRSEMAYDFLKSKGYRVNHLNGYVEFGKDGMYKIK